MRVRWQVSSAALCKDDLLFQESNTELSQFGNMDEEVVCQSEDTVRLRARTRVCVVCLSVFFYVGCMVACLFLS